MARPLSFCARLFLLFALLSNTTFSSFAQSITIDGAAPAANRPTLTTTGNGKPGINIVAPQSGVSTNNFTNFQVGKNGLIVNNSTANVTSKTGGAVIANDNLKTSGPANIIVNKVRGTKSTLEGNTEVVGTKAQIIIANPSGVECNGCGFTNTSKATLTTGTPTQVGSGVGIAVTDGVVSVGRDGITGDGDITLSGRHVLVDGAASAGGDLSINGGTHSIDPITGLSSTAPIKTTRVLPYAVDATEFGALAGGNIRIIGNEAGLGVRALGNVNARQDVTISSSGTVTTKNITAGGAVSVKAVDDVKQYGDIKAGKGVIIGGKSVYVPGGRTITAATSTEITATENATIGGTINAASITVKSTGNTQNTGSLGATNDAIIVSGGEVINTREKFTVYEGQEWADAWLKSYEAVFKEWGTSEDPDQVYWGNEYFKWTKTKIVDEYLLKGGSIIGSNVNVTAGLNILNEAGTIASTKDTNLVAALDISNLSKATTNQVDAADGCDNQFDCGTRQNFHPGEIMAGGNLSLKGRNITNSASTIAAFGDILINARGTIKNYALSASYVAKDFETETTSVNSTGLYYGLKATYVTDTITSSTVSSTEVDYAPGVIRSLTGSAKLKAGGSYLSLGSSIRAAKDITIDATGMIKLSSQAAIEKNTGSETVVTDKDIDLTYYGRNYSWDIATTSKTSVINEQAQVASVSELIGGDVILNASDFISTGSRIFSANDISIKAKGGVLLDGGADLLGKDNGELKAELKTIANLANSLKTDAATLANYRAYLTADSLTNALVSLHAMTSARTLDAYADKVGAKIDVSTITSKEVQYKATQVLQAYRSWFWTKYRWVTVNVPQYVSVDHADLDISEGAESLSAALSPYLTNQYGATSTINTRFGDDVINATSFDFAAADALADLDGSTRSLLNAGNNLTIEANLGDVVLTGGTIAAAGNDVNVKAGQDIVLLPLRGTGIGYGGDILDRQADFRAGFFWKTADSATQIRTLSPVSLISGGSTYLSAGQDINNFGGSVIAGSDFIASAGRDIQNDAIRYYYTLTAADGCQNGACGLDGHAFRSGEMLSGSGMVLSAGRDILNTGSNIAAAGTILATAGRNIDADALTTQFLTNYLIQKKKFLWFTYQTTKIIENSGYITDSAFASEFGDVRLSAANDILLTGVTLSAGGTVSADATRDIIMNARAEEISNSSSKSGIIGFGFGSQKRAWNGFVTAFPSIEANDIELTAGRNLTAIGAKFVSANDTVLAAANNITFDAQQNKFYDRASGWYFGFSSPALDILSSAFKGDGKAALLAYVNQNPLLAAVHSLATGSGTSTLGSALRVATSGARLLGEANSAARGPQMNAMAALVAQFNPVKDLGIDPFALFKNKGSSLTSTLTACTKSIKNCSFLSGISFRLSVWKSSQDWTESTVSRLLTGNDLTLSAGQDVALVGGTYVSAGRDATIVAGRNIGLTAVADTVRSNASSWGLTFGLTPTGFTVGGDASRNSSNGVTYSNAFLGAGSNIDLIAGQDIALAGANVTAKTIAIDAGRDLLVASQQNTSTSDGRSFNVSVSISPTGVPTGASLGGSFSKGRRTYTDTPTTIIADNDLDIYVGRNTVLSGAGIWSKTKKLKLDTGDLVYDNYVDKDMSVAVSANVNLNFQNMAAWRASGSAQYSNVAGITFATLGDGDIDIRNRPNLDISALNSNPANMQRITSKTSFSIDVPELNLAALSKDIKDARNFLNALTANVPQSIKDQGAQAVDQFEDLLLRGSTRSQAMALMQTPEYRQALSVRNAYTRAIDRKDGLGPAPSALILAIVKGEDAYWDAARGVYVIESNCGGTYGPTPCQTLVSAGKLKAAYTAADVQAYYSAAFTALATASGSASPQALQNAQLAMQCLVQAAIEQADPSIITTVVNRMGAAQFAAQLQVSKVDPYRVDLTVRILTAARAGDVVALARINSEVNEVISGSAIGRSIFDGPSRGTLSSFMVVIDSLTKIVNDGKLNGGPNWSLLKDYRIGFMDEGNLDAGALWIKTITLPATQTPTFVEKLPGFIGMAGVAVGGIMVAVEATPSVLSCLTNYVCRMEMAQGIGEALAGATPGTFGVTAGGVIVGGKLVLTEAEQIAARLANINNTAGTIRDINKIGGNLNCVNCVIATDATLAGFPTSALSGGPYPISVLESIYKSKFGAQTTISSISDSMLSAGNGARGIVFGSRGSEVGHVFNVVNQNGVIRFLDGQTGGAAATTGYFTFQLLRTK